ncbi:hypothetical protein [Paenibacillus daejeonensis]|uniref:hypothetical protein n=1 Tax=Paenibacillus daejeonensis TaxID=135193 RepID=UPI000370A420|nr:hypothetical protein [Paenibacillus daejeonensis]
MKIKKLFIVAITLVCMLSVVPSAFAVTDYADTQATAIDLFPVPFTDKVAWIDSNTDHDWYVYTNTNSTTRYLSAFASLPNGSYFFEAKYRYTNGFESGFINGSGSDVIKYYDNLQVLPGEKIFFRVRSSNPTGINYHLDFTVNS